MSASTSAQGAHTVIIKDLSTEWTGPTPSIDLFGLVRYDESELERKEKKLKKKLLKLKGM